MAVPIIKQIIYTPLPPWAPVLVPSRNTRPTRRNKAARMSPGIAHTDPVHSGRPGLLDSSGVAAGDAVGIH
jgi:hypothetical protein